MTINDESRDRATLQNNLERFWTVPACNLLPVTKVDEACLEFKRYFMPLL